MEDMELWTVYTSQVIALAAILGAVLGTLRKHNILTADTMEAAFQSADHRLPDTARPVGSNLLTHLRMVAEVAAHEGDPDEPHR